MSIRVHIAYSDRHFCPGKESPRTKWFSCSQIAEHTYHAFEHAGFRVTYGDAIPSGEPLDLLWTNRGELRTPNVDRCVYFASVAHLGAVRACLDHKVGRKVRGREGHGYYPLGTLVQYMQMLMRADRIVLIGNEAIRRSFERHAHQLQSRLAVLDCGVDTAHFAPVSSSAVCREPLYVHSVTHMSFRKGTDLVVEAWPRVAAAVPGARLLILGRSGDVTLPDVLSSRSDVELGGEFDSGSEKYIEMLSRSRWCVLPSLAEGQAGTLLEAMGCGCVPISTRETGVDVERYDGHLIAAPTSDHVVDAMVRAARSWNPLTPERVRSAAQKAHDWPLFESRIVDLALDVTRSAPLAYGVVLSKIYAFTYAVKVASGRYANQ